MESPIERIPVRIRAGLAVAGGVMALDQATKWWIVEVVMQPPRVIEVLPVFNLVLGWNRGVSFGMFSGDSPILVWVLVALALAIVAVLVAWLRRAEGWWTVAAIGIVIGGALGNVVDRLRFGAVADFLDFHLGGYHWPVFNVADTGITVGAAVLVIDSLLADRKRHKNKDGKTTGNRP